MSATNGFHDVSAIRAALLVKMGEAAADSFPEAIAQRFPHILARIADLWGSAALDAYLDGLMLDDRGERPGAMFADWELIGVPHRVTIGDRGLKDGQVEYQHRRDATATKVSVDEILGFVTSRLEK